MSTARGFSLTKDGKEVNFICADNAWSTTGPDPPFPFDPAKPLDINVNLLSLTKALNDPIRPACCPLCFYCWSLTNKPNEPMVRFMRMGRQDLLDASMSTLTAPRSDAELRIFQQHLLANYRSCDACLKQNLIDSFVGETDERRAVSAAALFISSLYRLMTACLADNQSALVSRAIKQKGFNKESENEWPSAPEQLFPHGPSGTVKTHIFWACLLPDPTAPIHFLNYCLIIARPFFYPRLVAPPNNGNLAWIVARMLGSLDTAAPDSALLSPPFALPEGWRFPVLKDSKGDTLVLTAISLLHTIRSGPDGEISATLDFITGTEAVLFPAVQSALALLPLSESSEEFSTLAAFAHLLQRRLGLPDSAMDARVIAWRQRVHPQRFTVDAILHHYLCQRARDVRACAGPGCGATVITSGTPGRAFQVCAKCKLLRYCSRECQRRDWTEGELPHKTLCKILRKEPFTARTLLGTSLDEWTAAWDRARSSGSVSDDDWLPLVAWAISDDMLPDTHRDLLVDLVSDRFLLYCACV